MGGQRHLIYAWSHPYIVPSSPNEEARVRILKIHSKKLVRQNNFDYCRRWLHERDDHPNWRLSMVGFSNRLLLIDSQPSSANA